jgi:ABC-type antimicrobial peptide transport system permease subunit
MDFTPGVPPPLPDAVRSEIAGVESVLFISGQWQGLISIEHNGERKMFEEQGNMAYTDSTYFNFFNRKVIAGDASLSKPNEAAISMRLATKFFGDENPIGKVIRLDNVREFTITGIVNDYSDKTSFPFDLFLSFETIRESKLQSGWGSVSSDDQCYVLLERGKHPEDFDRQMPEFIKKYSGEDNAKFSKRWLQSLDDLRYDTRFSNYRQRSMGRESIWAMSALALFLIITACINFVNLTTAVAVRRSKEVGIRKVLGSQRGQLVFQYLNETALITFLALIMSVGFAELALIYLNPFLDLNIHIDLQSAGLWTFIFTVWLVVSLISGLYPAFLLSGFSPIATLKNKLTNKASGGFVLRRGLVVFQFVISQFLIVGTIILITQMNYLQSKDLGFTKEAVVMIPLPVAEKDSITKKFLLRNQLRQLDGVEKVSLCSTPPSSGSVSVTDFQVDGVEGHHFAHIKVTDERYLDLFDMDLVAGRQFNDIDTANQYMVNEQLLKVLGLTPEEIVGRNLRMWSRNLPVVGVVKDFHTVSLARQIEPTVITKQPRFYFALAVKLEPGKFNTTINSIEKVWSSQYPNFLFNYEFLDEEIAQFYDGMERMSMLLIIFSGIAILIGCLGLYGLITFIATQKEKEIGIRKVLGATTQQIMVIFSKEFIVLIVIAFLIAAPLSGYVMDQWLQNYTYRVPLGGMIFVTGISTTLAIAFITIGYRSLRAATANPINALRSE